MTEVLNLFQEKLRLRPIYTEFSLLNGLKNIENILLMLIVCLTVYDNVIYKDHTAYPDKLTKNLFHDLNEDRYRVC